MGILGRKGTRFLALAVSLAAVASAGHGALGQSNGAGASKGQRGPGGLERRIALVIGNAAYPASPLRNPVNDARSMAEALRDLGFRVKKLENAGQNQMKEAIDDFGEALKGGGVGLFYYSGHGMQVKGRNFIIPVDAVIRSEPQAEYVTVDAGRVLAAMDAAGNGLNIVILDACRDNPFARSFRSSSSGLAQMDAPSGTLIAYATSPGRVASDGTGRNGLYTEQLLINMRTQGLPVEEMFKRVRVGVQKRSNNQQTPWESSSLVGEFAFAGRVNMAAIASPPAAPQRMDPEEEAWLAIKGSKDPQVFVEFRNDFPNGRFFRVAVLKEEALRREQGQAAVAPRPSGSGEPQLTAQQWFDKAQALWSREKFEYSDNAAAIRYLSAAVRIDPNYPAAWNNLGTAYSQAKQYPQALENYDHAIRLHAMPVHYDNRGHVHATLKDYGKAIQDYNQAISMDPNYAIAYWDRASAYSYLENWTQQRRDLKKSCDLKFQQACDWLAQNPEKPAQGASGESLTAQQWYDKSQGLWMAAQFKYSDPEAAIRDLFEAVRIDPNFVAAWNNLGTAYGQLEKYPQAIENYDRAIRLSPNDKELYLHRALILHRATQYDRAVEDYNRVIAMDPDYGRAYYNRGNAYSWLGNTAQQYQDYHRACDLKYRPACDELAKNPEK